MASGSDNGLLPDIQVFQQNCSHSDVEEQHVHRPLPNDKDRVYTPETFKTGPLRYPHKGSDETYLVLESEEEPVKSKPPKVSHPPGSEDSDTTDSNGVGVTKRAQPKQKSAMTRPDSPSGGDGDTESISEASSIIQDATNKEERPRITSQKMVTGTIRHSVFCRGVSRWQKSRHEFPIHLHRVLHLRECGIKIHRFMFHCRGLDQDYDQRYATLTAVVCFLPKAHACRRMLELYDCKITLAVDVYRDADRPENRIGTGPAVATRRLKDDERSQKTMHITVNGVVDLDEIVYPDRCPDAIILNITATLEATLIRVSATDSGRSDRFIEISTSVEYPTS